MDLEYIFMLLLNNNRLPQSILIESRDMSKAYNIAFRLASEILGTSNLNNEHPDLFFINPEKNIKIDEIKAVQDFCYLTPQLGDTKVVLIHNANKFTLEAANSILKILEEPVKKRFFILTVENKNQLLQTILSRCSCFRVKPEGNELDYFKEKIPLDILKKTIKFFKKVNEHNLSYYDIVEILAELYNYFDKIDDFIKFIILINDFILNEFHNEKEILIRINLINFFNNISKMIKVNISYKNILNLIAIYIKNRNFLKGENKIG